MAHRGNKGRPVQIVKLEGGKHFSLDTSGLKKILLAEHVKDLPVVVVSVAGKFREGKSFLLNFFLRYFMNGTQPNWMDDANAKLEGFSWRGGSERQTTGIFVWSEVFVVPTTGGKKVAVIFLDTQGIFDGKSTTKYSTKVFALSMMASSLQIYNISKQIGEDHLQHLHLFTQYGKLALRETGDEPFQELLFLVRDWPYEQEMSYGLTGGKTHMKKCLQIEAVQEPELKDVRWDISSSFKKISCFLMPDPGKKVKSERTFDGRLSDIDNDFKRELKVLVSSFLQPNKLVVKKINGCDISCKELLSHLESYGKVLNGDDLPDPKSMFEAFVEANNSTAVNRAIDLYRNEMESVLLKNKPFLDPETLKKEHERVMEAAFQLFRKQTKMGGEERSQKHKDTLQRMIDQMFESFSNRNEGERIKAEEKKILDDARRKARIVVENAQARAKRIQIASLVAQGASFAALAAPPGVAATAARTAGAGSAGYAIVENIYGLLTSKSTFDEDKKED